MHSINFNKLLQSKRSFKNDAPLIWIIASACIVWLAMSLFMQYRVCRYDQYNLLTMQAIQKQWQVKSRQKHMPISWHDLKIKTVQINADIYIYQWLNHWCEAWFCLPNDRVAWKKFNWSHPLDKSKAIVNVDLQVPSSFAIKQFMQWLSRSTLLTQVQMHKMQMSAQHVVFQVMGKMPLNSDRFKVAT